MEMVEKVLSVVGALLLSVSSGLLIEEMLIGGLVRLILARQPEARKKSERNSRKEKGERTCLR